MPKQRRWDGKVYLKILLIYNFKYNLWNNCWLYKTTKLLNNCYSSWNYIIHFVFWHITYTLLLTRKQNLFLLSSFKGKSSVIIFLRLFLNISLIRPTNNKVNIHFFITAFVVLFFEKITQPLLYIITFDIILQ